ncbi:MAG: heme A synthase, partial [alpha proteobacterium HIMB114]
MQKIQQNYDQTFIWLFTTSILLVVLIWIGGLTRLT